MDDFDILPTFKQSSEVVDSLACGEGPGNDNIPSEVLKLVKQHCYSVTSMSFFYIAGKRVSCTRICMIPRSSSCTETKGTAWTVQITTG